MNPLSLQQIADWCGGSLLQGSPDAVVSRVCTDSRQAQTGDLFLAIPGERFDGHDFLGEVAGKGAAAVVIEKSRASGLGLSCGVITVENPRAALGKLAANYRASLNLHAVAVGGSNGKTTTKELLASVLRQRFATLASEASFNNEVGVPITLLKLDAKHQAAVLEVGTNHPGELAPLVKMIQPEFGVITCIGREHLEFFNDLGGVADEEGWLAELLPARGKLFVNGDTPEIHRILSRAKAPVVRVGWTEGNDWRVREVRVDADGTTFKVESPYEAFSGEYRLQLLGRHQAGNALLALAVGTELGLTREQAARGLAECAPPKMRLQLKEINGVHILDDAYNANADSMLASLDTLCELPCEGRRVAVLGDMAELGLQSHAAHIEVGERAAELGLSHLFAVGKMAPILSEAARSRGFRAVSEFEDVGAAANAVRDFVRAGDLVLIKASRATRLERISETLATTGAPPLGGAGNGRLRQTAMTI
ncbi:MAG: UDP-N-acetylmuramoyl-tripeptide--D-alanyl-D-alanine ligase [Verrucomicrobiota bacterium]